MDKITKKIIANKGFTTTDIVISIIIIIIFVSIITTLFYNFYLSTSAKNRNAIALNCIIDVIEEAKMLNYDELDQTKIQDLLGILKSNKTIPNGYEVSVNVQRYNELEGNNTKKDLIKILKVKVEYLVGQKNEKIEISTLITKNKGA